MTPSRLSSWNRARISTRGAAVEGAGRLVGEDEARLVDERARDRDALLLAAGELRRAMMRAIGEADAGERRHAPCSRRVRAVDAGIDHRQLDIAERVGARQQVELLEDEADLAVAQGGEAVGAQRLDAPCRRGGSCRAVGRSRQPTGS